MVLLHVKVVPGARRDRVVGRYGEGIKVQVAAPPENGKANEAVIQLIAGALGIASTKVRLVRGLTSPRKVLRIDDADPTTIEAWKLALPG